MNSFNPYVLGKHFYEHEGLIGKYSWWTKLALLSRIIKWRMNNWFGMFDTMVESLMNKLNY